MRAKRVDCMFCENFQVDESEHDFKYSCELGKRVMFRNPVGYWYFDNEFLFPRYCNDFKEVKINEKIPE